MRAAVKALAGQRQAGCSARRGDRGLARRRRRSRQSRDDYRKAFFTEKGEVRKTLATKARVAAMSDIDRGSAQVEADRLEVRAQPCKRAALWSSSRWRSCGSASTSPNVTRRPSGGAATLDYDDLIVATRRLLESAESAAWVLYKLDGGIDHVLVDEAQDTNPDQWEVIRSLTEEFFAGESAVTDRDRTIFAVGDTKQSIFGFQRADPAQARRDARLVPGTHPVRPQATSSRSNSPSRSARRPPCSTPSTGCSASPKSAKGCRGQRRGHPPSRAARTIAGARRVVAAGHGRGCRGRHRRRHGHARSLKSSTDAASAAGTVIALHAKSLIGGGERRAKDGMPLHPGHFMVLVRRRNEFVGALVRQLKREQRRGGRRRPPQPWRRAGDPGPARHGALRAVAAGRSQPRLPAEVATDRPRRRAALYACLEAQRPSLALAARPCARARVRRRLRSCCRTG